MRVSCRTFLIILGLAYLVAVVIHVVGTFGWLSLDWDPLSVVVLIILGLPWILFPLGALIDQAYWPAVAAAAPLFNLAIVRLICRRVTR